MSDQQRPPTSGPGSGVTAWRAYAAVVTSTDVDEWGEMSREDIVALLDGDTGDASAAGAAPVSASRRRGPVWMVPEGGEWVPENELRRR